MTTLAIILATAAYAGDVACGESSQVWHDAHAVMQVARNRALTNGRTLVQVLARPAQFAAPCSASARRRDLHLRHVLVGLRAIVGALDVPEGMDEARWFCAEKTPTWGCGAWRAPDSWARWRLVEVGATRWGGRVFHRYYRERRPRARRMGGAAEARPAPLRPRRRAG